MKDIRRVFVNFLFMVNNCRYLSEQCNSALFFDASQTKRFGRFVGKLLIPIAKICFFVLVDYKKRQFQTMKSKKKVN